MGTLSWRHLIGDMKIFMEPKRSTIVFYLTDSKDNKDTIFKNYVILNSASWGFFFLISQVASSSL
jgi:hypothetical protein